MDERDRSAEAELTINFFAEMLQDCEFSDHDARAAFYDIAHYVTVKLELGSLECLRQHRPHVSELIKQELEQV